MSTDATKVELPSSVKRYALYLMVMAGLGGLLYGIDVGVIAAALPYIEKTSSYTPQELAIVVAAVLFGSVLSSLFAGMLAEWLGRKKVIIISALLFTLSIPVICFSNGVFEMLMGGRILQGASAGLVGVVVPMYLAECLDANSRGKGTGMFQFMLTVGLVFAALIGLVTTMWVGAADDPTVTAESKTMAWQVIFWCSAIPGLILFFGRILCAAANDRFDPCHKLFGVKGFCDIVVCTELKTQYLIKSIVLCRQHDDRRCFILADTAENFHTVHAGHHDIEQNEIRVFRFDDGKTCLSIIGNKSVITLFFKIQFDDLCDIHVIIDHKYLILHFGSTFQFLILLFEGDDRYAGLALTVFSKPEVFHMRMLPQKCMDIASENARAFAMNDGDFFQAGEKSIIEVLIQLDQRIFNVHTLQIDGKRNALLCKADSCAGNDLFFAGIIEQFEVADLDIHRKYARTNTDISSRIGQLRNGSFGIERQDADAVSQTDFLRCEFFADGFRLLLDLFLRFVLLFGKRLSRAVNDLCAFRFGHISCPADLFDQLFGFFLCFGDDLVGFFVCFF